MFSKKLIAAAAVAMLAAQSCYAADDKIIDSVYTEFGTGFHVDMARVGVTSNWERRWLQSNGTHISGYWDASMGAWRGDRYLNISGRHQSLFDIGLVPVFRFENDNKKGIYYEGGIGIHGLSKLYDNADKRLSTHFQFGDHIGIGYVFENKWEMAIKAQHFSNGGYKRPNSGVNYLVVKAAYNF
ncbi:MAG: acyloxyacyl hydrolase [Pseudomonadota bacterium]